MPKVAKGRERRLDKATDEEGRLLAACRASRSIWLHDIVRMALETGMRRGEILSLQWKHIDLAQGTAHLPDTKNGDSRTVPLSSAAMAILRAIPRSIEGRVFPIGESGFVHIPCLRQNPKYRRIYDAKIVSDSIAKGVPLGRNVIAQEWVRAGAIDGPLTIAQGLVGLRLGSDEGGARLRDGVRALGEGVPGWFRALVEATLMGWSEAEIKRDFPEWAKALRSAPSREGLLAVVGGLRGSEIQRSPKLAARLQTSLDLWLSRGALLDLSDDEFRSIAETLQDLGRYGVLADFAREQRKRSSAGDKPIYRFFHIVARVQGDGWRMTEAEIDALEEIGEQAMKARDMSLVNRVEAILATALPSYAFPDDPFLDDDIPDFDAPFLGGMDDVLEELERAAGNDSIDSVLDSFIDVIVNESRRSGVPLPLSVSELRAALREELLGGRKKGQKGARRGKGKPPQTEFGF